MPKGNVGVTSVFPPKAKDSYYDDKFPSSDLYPCTCSCLDLCWELRKWKMMFCHSPLGWVVLTEPRAGGEVRCQVALEEPVAVDAYVAVIIKWSSLQVYQVQHKLVVCVLISNHAHFRNN